MPGIIQLPQPSPPQWGFTPEAQANEMLLSYTYNEICQCTYMCDNVFLIQYIQSRFKTLIYIYNLYVMFNEHLNLKSFDVRGAIITM